MALEYIKNSALDEKVISCSLSSIGNKNLVIAKINMPSSYPSGGIALTPIQTVGMHHIEFVTIDPEGGFVFKYDYDNNKIKCYIKAPPIVYEEKHTVTDDVITLRYPAAFIMNVAISGQNKAMRSTGIALASLSDNQCSLVSQMAAGELTQLTVRDWDRLGGDGAFTGGTTNWTFNTDDWTYGSNTLAKDEDGVTTLTHDTFAAVVGRTYRITYTISGTGTTGTLTATCGGTAGTAQTLANGTFVEEITATTTDGIVFTPSNTSRFTIDSITIYDLSEPVYVTYVTQAWKEVWDNLVQDEAITLATGANTLSSGNKIAACMYIDQITATAAALLMIDEDDTVASGEVDLKLNSATGQFTVHSDQNAKAAKTTYIKVPASGFIADRLITNESATKTGSDPYVSTFAYPILIWSYAGQVPVNGQTTKAIIDYAGTPASGEAVVDWFGLGARGAGAPAAGTMVGLKDNQTATGAYIWGAIHEIETALMETPDGTDLSDITLRAMFIGV